MKSYICVFTIFMTLGVCVPVFGQVWEQEFKLDVNPEVLNKRWQLNQWRGGTSGYVNGRLKLSTGGNAHNAAAGVIWKITGKSGDTLWDGSRPSTVEFRVAVATAGKISNGATVTVADGQYMYHILLKPCAMKTYRIVLEKNKALLFERGNSIPITIVQGDLLSGNKDDNNYIYFGDGGVHVDGTSTWQFIRWTNAGAFTEQPSARQIAFGFSRMLNFEWLPEDSRQWENYNKSIVITDLSQSQPPSVISVEQRQKGKWKVLPYKTDQLTGKALSVYGNTKPVPIKIPVKQAGIYGVYIGLSTVAGLHDVTPSGVRAKLGSDIAYKSLYNNMSFVDYRRDVIHELLLTVDNIETGETVDISSIPFTPGTVAYIRLVPVSKKEYGEWKKENEQLAFKRNITAIDGHGLLLFNQARTAADIAGHFRYFENSDYGKWWYQVTGADLVNYPSQIGTLAGGDTEDFSRWYDEEYVASVKGLIANGVNSLKVAKAIAVSQKSEFHIMLRAQGWAGSIPFEETFDSKFYQNHPEWRCVDRAGTPTMYMSYAIPQVRQHLLNVFKETVEMSDPDGVGILFNRGAPFMLWESAFAEQFKKEYGIDVQSVDADDSRIHSLRAGIITGFLKDLRIMLDDLGKKRGGKHYKISASVLSMQLNGRLGLDVVSWIKNGIVDDIAVAVPDLAGYAKIAIGTQTKIYPLLTPWDRYSNPKAFYENITNLYSNGATGIAVWDGDMGLYRNSYNVNLREVVTQLGHKDLIAHWSKVGPPEPNVVRLTKLGDNEYSEWLPNAGF